MAKIFKNPSLPDYFLEGSPDRDYVGEYEAANVVLFPKMAKGLDHDFWAGLDGDAYAALRKLRTTARLEDPGDVQAMRTNLRKAGLADDLALAVCEQASILFKSVIPHYLNVFSGYRLITTKVVFRLSVVRAENMHFDLYKEADQNQFARMFINLDNQPRIWHTSWRATDAIRQFGDRVDLSIRQNGGANDIWNALTPRVFGRSSLEWWDSEPRHIAFFDPGDAWIVDSRQVAHQIFYGRRAVSLDFAVDRDTMRSQSSHYLNLAESLRVREPA